MSIERRSTKQIMLGGIAIGGTAPITIQSMTNTNTADIESTLQQINFLSKSGCDIVRLAVPDKEAAAALQQICLHSPVPLIADIHFDYHLAIEAVKAGIHGLRLNPGNIGSDDKVRQVVSAARERMIPIRIGVNTGSLPKDIQSKYGVSATAMVESALRHVSILEKLSYEEIKLSVKASSIPLTLDSYRLLSQKVSYPLHLGLTEAGTMLTGTVQSSIAIGTLLEEGIGDTIRVSLTADPVQEVIVAKEILKSLGIRKGLKIISCPTCGRTKINLIHMAEEVGKALQRFSDQSITVAVMGCAVNGPGEAREADFGIAGGVGEGLIFRKGEIIKKVPEAQLVTTLVQMVEEFLHV